MNCIWNSSPACTKLGILARQGPDLSDMRRTSLPWKRSLFWLKGSLKFGFGKSGSGAGAISSMKSGAERMLRIGLIDSGRWIVSRNEIMKANWRIIIAKVSEKAIFSDCREMMELRTSDDIFSPFWQTRAPSRSAKNKNSTST